MKIYMTLSIRMKQPVHQIAIFSLLTLLLNLREFQFLSHTYQQGLLTDQFFPNGVSEFDIAPTSGGLHASDGATTPPRGARAPAIVSPPPRDKFAFLSTSSVHDHVQDLGFGAPITTAPAPVAAIPSAGRQIY